MNKKGLKDYMQVSEKNEVMRNEILFSIIMPTYNSQDTIEMALKSIRMQDLPQESIEILVIDGGSSDETLKIAEKYGAIILENEKRFPEYAKRIGFEKARGRWLVMEDSDEVLTDVSQLRKRKEFFEKNKEVHCLVLDKYIPGKNCGICCEYVNWVGDPFNYIVYKISDSRVRSYRKNLKYEDETGNIYYFGKNDIMPIGDGGTTTIDIVKAKELFGEEYFTQEFAVSAFNRMVLATKHVGCISEDSIVHYSLATFRTYLKKLDFRIYTNLNGMDQAGYAVRAKNNKKLRNRKILFGLYCLSVVLPLVDSVKLSIRYKKVNLLLHFFFTYYVVLKLVIEIIKKSLHIESKGIRYGK